jgi:hypothetical protein
MNWSGVRWIGTTVSGKPTAFIFKLFDASVLKLVAADLSEQLYTKLCGVKPEAIKMLTFTAITAQYLTRR